MFGQAYFKTLFQKPTTDKKNDDERKSPVTVKERTATDKDTSMNPVYTFDNSSSGRKLASLFEKLKIRCETSSTKFEYSTLQEIFTEMDHTLSCSIYSSLNFVHGDVKYQPIQGHPHDFIEYVSNILYQLVDIGLSNNPIPSTEHSQVLTSSKITSIHLINNEGQYHPFSHLRVVCQTLSVLSNWQTNRFTMWNRLGKDFPGVLVGTLVTLTSKLKTISGSALSICFDNLIDGSKFQFADVWDIVDTLDSLVHLFTRFIVSFDNLTIQLSSHDDKVNQKQSVSHPHADFIELPKMPWNSVIRSVLTGRKSTDSEEIVEPDNLRKKVYNLLLTHDTSRYFSYQQLSQFSQIEHPVHSTMFENSTLTSAQLHTISSNQIKLRRADEDFSFILCQNGLHAACMYLIDSLRNLLDVILSFVMENFTTMINEKDFQTNPVKVMAWKQLSWLFFSCLVLQTETLFLVSESIFSMESVNDLIECEFDTVLSCILSHCVSLDYDSRLNILYLSELPWGSETITKLLLKRGFLLLEINEKVRVRVHSGDEMHSSSTGATSTVALINNELIVSFMTWIAKNFTFRDEEIDKMSESNNALLSLIQSISINLESRADFSHISNDLALPSAFDKRKSQSMYLSPALEPTYHLSKIDKSNVSLPVDSIPQITKAYEWLYQIPGAAAWAALFESFSRSYFHPSADLSETTIQRCIFHLNSLVISHLASIQLLLGQSNNSYVPICQFFYIKFLSVCFQLYPHMTLESLRKVDVWTLLFGRHFMFGGVDAISMLAKSEIFERTVPPLSSNQINIVWATKSNASCRIMLTSLYPLSWVALHDQILDFSQKLILFKLGSEIQPLEVEQNLELSIISSALLTHSNNFTIHSMLASYQVLKWMNKLYADSAESAFNSNNFLLRSTCIKCSFDMIGKHLELIRTISSSTAPSSSSLSTSSGGEPVPLPSDGSLCRAATIHTSTPAPLPFPINLDSNSTSDSVAQNLIPLSRSASNGQKTEDKLMIELFWSTRAASIDFLCLLFADAYFHANGKWLELFYMNRMDIKPNNLDKKFGITLSKEEANKRSFIGMLSTLPQVSTRSKFQEEDGSRIFNLENSTSISHGPGKDRIKLLETLLLDIRCQRMAASILTNIILACAQELHCVGDGETHTVQPSGLRLVHGLTLQTIEATKSLSLYVVERMIEITRLTIMYPKSPDSYQIALVCIQSLINMLIRSKFDSSIQDFFRKSDAISNIISSLNGLNHPNEVNAASNCKPICLDILREGLRLTTCLMIGNSSMKTNFRSMFLSGDGGSGEVHYSVTPAGTPVNRFKRRNKFAGVPVRQFTQMMADMEPTSKISVDTITIIFEMLMDKILDKRDAKYFETNCKKGLFLDDIDGVRILNEESLFLMMNMVPFCKTDTQEMIFTSLQNLLVGKASLVNLAACSKSRPPVLDLALDLFAFIDDEAQTHLVQLLQILGKYSISVSQMKHLFKIMQVAIENRPNYNSRVLEALHGMIREDDGPRHSFVFNGITSGIILSPIHTWPSKKGFAFSIWFRIDPKTVNNTEFPNISTNFTSHEPYLLSFRSSSVSGFDVFLKPHVSKQSLNFLRENGPMYDLIVQSYSDGKILDTLSSYSLNFQAKENCWHFLSVSFKPATMRVKSEITIYFDNFCHRQIFAYPNLFKDVIHQPCIGRCFSPAPLQTQSGNFLFRGQMSSINMFSDVLSKQRMQSIHALGCSYFYCFESFTRDYNDVRKVIKKNLSGELIDAALDGTLNSLLMLSYNPVVVNGNIIIDNTPSKNNINWRGTSHVLDLSNSAQGLNATRLPGTVGASTNDVRIALDALGGAKSLLPIFRQLDQPRILSVLKTESKKNTVDESPDTKLSYHLFQLLSTILENISENDRTSQNYSVFEIIDFFLPSISPLHLNEDSLDILIKIFYGQTTNPAIQDLLLDTIFCNFSLWVPTPVAVQLKLVSWLKTLRNTDGKLRLFNVCGFQRILEIVYCFYEYDRLLLSSSDSTIKPVSKQSNIVDDSAISQSSPQKFTNSSRSISLNSPNSNDSPSANTLRNDFLAQMLISPRTQSASASSRSTTELLQRHRLELSVPDLQHIRDTLFEILFILVTTSGQNICVDDIHLLISYILNTNSESSKSEGLTLLIKMLDLKHDSVVSLQLLKGLAHGKCIYSLATLCSSTISKVRLKTMVAFCKVIDLANEFRELSHSSLYVSPGNSLHPCSSKSQSSHCVDYQTLDADLLLNDKNSRSRKSSGHKSEDFKDIFDTTSSSHKEQSSRSNTFTSVNYSTDDNSSHMQSSFEELGLTSVQFPIILTSIKQSLINSLKLAFAKTAANNSLNRECEIIVLVLQKTLFGDSLGVELVEAIDNSDNFTTIDVQAHKLSIEPLDSDMRICVPLFFTIIIQFITENVVPQPLRLSVLCHLKASLSATCNSEIVLRLPNWQDCVFQLVIFEHNQMRVAKESLVQLKDSLNATLPHSLEQVKLEKSITKSQAILDACLRIISDLHVSAVRVGKPAFPAPIARKKDSIKTVSAVELLNEVSRGERLLGVTVLRDTIACLRFYGQQGELDVEKTGCALLLQTLFVLERELSKKPSQDSALNRFVDHENSIQEYIDRTFPLNVWLCASIVLNFITVPNVQGLPQDGTELAHISSTASSVNGLDDTRTTSLYVESKPSFSHVTTQLASHVSSQQVPVSVLTRQIEDIEPTSLSDILINMANEQRGYSNSVDISAANQKTNGLLDKQQDLIWHLLDRLICLLDTLEPGSPNYLQASSQVGLRTGAKVLARINEEINYMVQPLSQSGDKIQQILHQKKFQLNLNSFAAKTPLSSATGAVGWIIIRVLTSMLVTNLPSASINPDFSADCSVILTRLKRVLRYCENKDVDFCTFESLHIVTKLCSSFQHFTITSSNRSIIRDLIEFMLHLAKDHRDVFVELITHFRKDSLSNQTTTLSSLSQLSPPSETPVSGSKGTERLTRASLDSNISTRPSTGGKRVVVISANRGMMTSSYIKNSINSNEAEAHGVVAALTKFDIWVNTVLGSLQNLPASNNSPIDNFNDGSLKDGSNKSLHEIFLKLINMVLQVYGFEITWHVWSQLVSVISVEAKRMDDESSKMKLTELGLEKHSQEVRTVILQRNSSESKTIDDWRLKCVGITTYFQSILPQRINNLHRAIISRDRKNELKWGSILSELANERGCWYYSVHPDRRVFWMLDPLENAVRQRPRLTRNEYGNQHDLATRFSNSYRLPAGQNTTGNRKILTESLIASVDNRTYGIWKDLNKYKKLTLNSPKPTGKLVGSQIEDADDLFSDPDEDENITIDTSEGMSGIEQLLFKEFCEIITVSSNAIAGRTPGMIELTKSKLCFTRSSDSETFEFKNTTSNDQFSWVCKSFPSTTWNIADIYHIYGRHYLLQFIACEIFFTSRTSVFINFFNQNTAKDFFKNIVTRCRPPLLPNYVTGSYRHPDIAIRALAFNMTMTWTAAWVDRKISNFEYLMKLNTIAGRSFNDVGQYPVFPWILRDYESTKLDLRNPSVFRDLKWPVGAQTEEQRKFCHQHYHDANEMYENNSIDEFPPYHYGSHYSCMGFVFWYLIRMEPYTSLGIWLQDGKFDQSDRLFYNLHSTWKGTTTNHSDVKELIPEFFFCPEFLENLNGIDLGTMQSGRKLDAVELPPWCANAYDFVRLHRDALESEYVSQFLHNWIDLIFGYKQRPPSRMLKGNEAAVEACNVFFHLTYVDAVNLSEVKARDDGLYQRTIRQIDNYGQTPCQLFTKPHPKRLPFSHPQTKIVWPIASCVLGVDTVARQEDLPKMPSCMVVFQEEKLSMSPIIFLSTSTKYGRLISIDTNRLIGLHSFVVKEADVLPPFSLKIDSVSLKVSSGLHLSSSKLDSTSFLSRINLSSINIIPREYYVGLPFSPLGLATRSSTYFYDLDRFDPRWIGTPENKNRFELIDAEKSASKKRERNVFNRINSMKSSSVFEADTTVNAAPEENSPEKQPFGTIESLRPDTDHDIQFFSSMMGTEESSETSSQTTYRGSITAAFEPSNVVGASRTPKGSRKRPEKTVVHSKGTKEYPQGKDYDLSSHLFALIPDYRLLLSCGHWDYSFKVTFVESGKLVQSITVHSEVVTCIALTEDFGKYWIATGSRDCTVMIWEVVPERTANPVTTSPLHVLYGHDDTVTAVAVLAELDLVVSGSDDGSIIIHSLRRGSFIHSIVVGLSSSDVYTFSQSSNLVNTAGTLPSDLQKPLSPSSKSRHSISTSMNGSESHTVKMLGISKSSYVIVYSSDGRNHRLYTYSINGRLLCSTDSEERLFCMCLSEDGRVLVTGGERCLIVFRWLHDLRLANDGPRFGQQAVLDGSSQSLAELDQGPFTSAIRSIHLTPRESHLIVGLDSGNMRILAQDSEYLRKRLINNLENIGLISSGSSANAINTLKSGNLTTSNGVETKQ